jgi:hypothetical protein
VGSYLIKINALVFFLPCAEGSLKRAIFLVTDRHYKRKTSLIKPIALFIE